jgi:uncharacterized protein (DUF2141 family)
MLGSNRLLTISTIAVFTLAIGQCAAASDEFVSQELSACTAELVQLCSAVKKGNGRTVQCLQEHIPELTPACKKAVVPDDGIAGTVSLEVTVTGIDSKLGSVIVMLYDDADKYPKSPRRMAMVPPTGDTVVVTFKHLKPNVYAVMAFHDTNENAKFDPGSKPSESIAVSNDAMMPTFDAAAIKVSRATKIKMALTTF